MTFDIGVGHDIRRTRRAIEKRHFAKRHAGREGREPVTFFAGQKHTDRSANDEEDFAGIIASGDDVLAALEGFGFQQRFNGIHFDLRKIFEELIISQLGFVARCMDGPRMIEQPFFTPFQGEIVVGKDGEEFSKLAREFFLHHPPQQR